jgi:hypothetical protein
MKGVKSSKISGCIKVLPAPAAAESVRDMHEDCGPVAMGAEYQPGPALVSIDEEAPDKSILPIVSKRRRLSPFQSVCSVIGAGVGGIDGVLYSNDDLEYVACRGAGLGCRAEPYEYSDDDASVLSMVRAGSTQRLSKGLSGIIQGYEVAGPAHRFGSNKSDGSTSGREE